METTNSRDIAAQRIIHPNDLPKLATDITEMCAKYFDTDGYRFWASPTVYSPENFVPFKLVYVSLPDSDERIQLACRWNPEMQQDASPSSEAETEELFIRGVMTSIENAWKEWKNRNI